MKQAKGITTGYWIATSLFALQMGFTAYAQLRIPQVAAATAPPRVEVAWQGGRVGDDFGVFFNSGSKSRLPLRTIPTSP